MTSAALAPTLDRPVVRARWATAGTFAVNGAMAGSYASRIPGLKSTLDVSDSGLGRTLFALAIGSLISLQFAGKAVGRFGSRRCSLVGSITSVLGFFVLGAADTVPVAVAGLLVMGAGFSLLDVAMNSQAVFVEIDYRRPIMSSFHAAFSIGSLIGAGLGAILAHQDVGQQAQYLVTAAITGVLVVTCISQMRGADPTAPEPDAETVATPTRRFGVIVAIFGTIAFAGMLSEGAAADWSGVHLRDTLGWTEGAAARGFVAFQIFMVVGRLAGDRVVHALGTRRVLLASASLTAVGFGAGLLADSGWPFVAGLCALGLGLAVIVPVVFSTAAKSAGSAGAAIARVSTLGYAGFLVGPPVIGQLADWTSTTWALGVLPVLAVITIVIVWTSVERAPS